ncbi:MAG: Factor arrest protein 11 [Pleopsidium flavum]|nr:MAG: Factor arrest protein 11 [Pleopsidium flavum]
MAEADPSGQGPNKESIVVKTDEVDEAGADISTISPTDDPEFDANFEAIRARLARAKEQKEQNIPPSSAKLPTRPQLRRDGSAPPAPQQPPPPAPRQQQQEDVGNTTDSLSLLQLKRLVTDMPRVEPVAYAFDYRDTQSFPEEIDEWFQYTGEDRDLVLQGKVTFEAKWKIFIHEADLQPGSAPMWTQASDDKRGAFIAQTLAGLEDADLYTRVSCLEAIVYVALGSWYDTAGLKDEDGSRSGPREEGDESGSTHESSSLQIQWMLKGVDMILGCSGLQPIFNVFKRICEQEQDYDSTDWYAQMMDDDRASLKSAQQKEINNIFTLMYLLVEGGREQSSREDRTALRDGIAALEPDFLLQLVQLIAKLRWDDTMNLPLNRVLLLFWKSVLLLFGGMKELNELKVALQNEPDRSSDEHGQPFITASPLDYHLFRQEITSKYPAYNPPPPLVTLELENNSILPPLPNHSSRTIGPTGSIPGLGPTTVNGSGGSILHQPVHIATPAPSPPPSPSGPGGKAGKKQNYQTNQNFPFLYPPLDGTSNNLGGKGSAGLQDVLVGKKWEGGDVPASILEAGKLFASRMRMTRAMQQLWGERERFMKYERGWAVLEGTKAQAELDEEAELENDTEDFDKDTENKQHKVLDPESKRRLNAVEGFYRHAMPQLQSVVIVLLKVVLANVTALVTQLNGNGQNGAAFGFTCQDNGESNGQGKPTGNINHGRQLNGKVNGHDEGASEDFDSSVEELNTLRLREISSKAVSGVLLLLLKWFKLSHILKYEYLTQLLLDSNYLPLILKLFAHQDVDKAVDQRNDRDDLSFFNLCHLHSKHPPPEPIPAEDSSSEDEAAPPPISKHRRSPTTSTVPSPPLTQQPATSLRPEVDELGYPTTALPSSPITTFSYRNFFSAITYLRIMQKITKHKAHRALLLVQYKSSTILRKALKIPQPDLRLYTLKLFKSQVPYCGRKWRQSNMRVITAIYLHCRPELRDDWLAGSDVDADVEEALPLEQAIRGLTHWWHLRCYPEQMGKEQGVLEKERDFFVRELESMGWGLGVGTGDGEVAFGEEAQEVANAGAGLGTEWEGPLQMEGW